MITYYTFYASENGLSICFKWTVKSDIDQVKNIRKKLKSSKKAKKLQVVK